MKQTPIKVGVKGLKEPFIVQGRIAENVKDLMDISKGDEKVIVRLANRGFRIEQQERSGARDIVRDELKKDPQPPRAEIEKAVAAAVAGYDPTQTVTRERTPKEPVTVTLAKKKQYTMADFAAALAAKGIKVDFQIEGEEKPAAAPAGTPAPATTAPATAGATA